MSSSTIPYDVETAGNRAGHVLEAGPLHDKTIRVAYRTHYPRLSSVMKLASSRGHGMTGESAEAP